MVIAEREIQEEIREQDGLLRRKEMKWGVPDCGEIYEGAILPMGAVSEETLEFELRVDKAFTVGATGHKRNGKSIFLTRAGVTALAMGLPVWSNYPIQFDYITYNDDGEEKRKRLTSQPLDWQALYMLDSELEYGVVIISEIQQWLDNRASMRLNNRLFSYILRQIGKRHLSLWYDCFSLDTIDKRLPAETDVEVYCEDMRKTFWGKTKGTHLEEGEYIKLTCYARTNAWLGFTTWDRNLSPEYTLYGKPYWKCYDTGFLFDPFEAMAGIDLDLEKIHITNKNKQSFRPEAALRGVIEAALANETTIIRSQALWTSAGMTENDSRLYGSLLKSLNVRKKQRADGYFYDLTEYQPSEG